MPGALDPRERNPVHIFEFYNEAFIAPHGDTVRQTYTVPAGKMALLEHLSISFIRDGAAPGVALYSAYANFHPAGGGGGVAIRCNASGLAVGTTNQAHLEGSVLFLAGDTIELVTVDTAGGGSVRYHLAYKLTEYDA